MVLSLQILRVHLKFPILRFFPSPLPCYSHSAPWLHPGDWSSALVAMLAPAERSPATNRSPTATVQFFLFDLDVEIVECSEDRFCNRKKVEMQWNLGVTSWFKYLKNGVEAEFMVVFHQRFSEQSVYLKRISPKKQLQLETWNVNKKNADSIWNFSDVITKKSWPSEAKPPFGDALHRHLAHGSSVNLFGSRSPGWWLRVKFLHWIHVCFCWSSASNSIFESNRVKFMWGSVNCKHASLRSCLWRLDVSVWRCLMLPLGEESSCHGVFLGNSFINACHEFLCGTSCVPNTQPQTAAGRLDVVARDIPAL